MEMIKILKANKILLFIVVISFVLDYITTIIGLGMESYETNEIASIFIQYFGRYTGLTIFSIGKIGIFTVGYMFFTKILPSILSLKDKSNFGQILIITNVILFVILLTTFIISFLTVVNNSLVIWEKMNI